jgi:hypothetical protein
MNKQEVSYQFRVTFVTVNTAICFGIWIRRCWHNHISVVTTVGNFDINFAYNMIIGYIFHCCNIFNRPYGASFSLVLVNFVYYWVYVPNVFLSLVTMESTQSELLCSITCTVASTLSMTLVVVECTLCSTLHALKEVKIFSN